jgi:hypothetical protein
MRAAALVVLAACGPTHRPAAPIANSMPATDPLAELVAIRDGLCDCLHHQEGELDESCPSPFADRYNAWAKRKHDDLTPAQRTRLAELDEEAHRCFQASIGDPLPPKRSR